MEAKFKGHAKKVKSSQSIKGHQVKNKTEPVATEIKTVFATGGCVS